MVITTLQGRREYVRSFIDTILEAHYNPNALRPTLAGLTDCITNEETTGLSRDEELLVEPKPYRPHPAGNLCRSTGAADIWAHVSDTGCYLHIPGGFAAHYMFEIFGDRIALALQTASQLPGLELSENFTEVPVDRLIIDPSMVMILVPSQCQHSDIEILVS